LPINQSFAFGVGAYGVAGMGVDYKQNLYGGTTYSSYSQMRFAPGISYKINDMFSAGVAVNLMFAQMEFDAAGGFGQQPHMGAGSFGGGATIGVQVRPVKMLTIGLAYETQSFFQDFAFDTPMHTGVNPATFQPIPNIPAGREKLKFNQPSVITLGLGAKPIDALAVGVDVGLIRWSETNGENKPEWTSDPNATGTMPWNLNWKDQVVLKVGVQYAVVPWLRVRAGYNYGKMPLDASRAFENIAFPAIAEHHVTAGLGINTSDKVAINLGGMISPKATLSGSNPNFPAMGGQAIQSYETTMTQMSVDLGVSYKF
jgi:long-chain fatty acid transport protein